VYIQCTALSVVHIFDLKLRLYVWLLTVDGYQATAALREMGVTIPIVALTGNALAEDQHRFMAAGANALLTKPVTSAVLQAALLAHAGWRP